MRKIIVLIMSFILCLSLTSCMTIKAVMYDPNAIKEEVITPAEENILEVEAKDTSQQNLDGEFTLVSSKLKLSKHMSTETVDTEYIKTITFNEDGSCIISGYEDSTFSYEMDNNSITIMKVEKDGTGTLKYLYEYLSKKDDYWTSENISHSNDPIDIEMLQSISDVDSDTWVYRIYYIDGTISQTEEGSYEDTLDNPLNNPLSTTDSSKPSMLIMIPLIVISLGLTILIIISQWKLFTKAGEKGWKSLVPIYNMWTLFKIAYGEGIRMFLTWIPVAGFIFMILFLFALADAYGKEKIGFKLGLLFLAPVFMPIIGLSKKIQYIGPKAKK